MQLSKMNCFINSLKLHKLQIIFNHIACQKVKFETMTNKYFVVSFLIILFELTDLRKSKEELIILLKVNIHV